MSSAKHRRSGDMSDRMINEIVAARPKSSLLKTRKQIDAYLRHYFANVPHEDMAGRIPRVMGQAALEHLEFAKTREPGEAKLRIFNPQENKHG